MWKAKKSYLLILLTILFLGSFVLFLSSRNATEAKKSSECFKGYNKERNKWTTGNLGKAYVEGDFVSYQLRIDKTSKLWGATKFSISFNFHQRSSRAIYVDGFDTSEKTGFQWSTKDFLPNGTPTPPSGWGRHIPTPDAGEPWTSGPKITNYMDAWPPGTGDGMPLGSYPAKERYFTVSGIPWEEATSHITLFFRAHLALDIIWSEGLETALPTVLDGDEFETWIDAWKGASFATGSSRHFYLRYPGIGKRTIPIPIARYPATVINGHKYVNDAFFNGWEITLTGELSLGPGLPPIPYTPPSVFTGTSPWTTGYFEFTGLIGGSYTVQEEDRSGYVHEDILTSGDGTNEVKDISEGRVSFDLAGGGMHKVDFYNSRYVDLTISKTATSFWEQTFTWAIRKTATPMMSEIFVGDITDVKYTITVTATPTTNVYKVSGIITIDNPNPAIVEVYATLLNEIWDGTDLIGFQDLTPEGAILIPSGVSTYNYSITLPDIVIGKTYTNKVIVEVTTPVSETYYAEKTFSFTTPTKLVDEEVDVEDNFKGFLGTVHYSDSPKSFEYIRTFGPYSAVGSNTIDNTAAATGKDTGTEWTASTTVKIDVSDVTVSKTANTHWKRVFKWSIEKSAEAAQIKPFINDHIEVMYTINVMKTVDTDTFKVSGTITIMNNNLDKPAETHVIDKIYNELGAVVAFQDLLTHTIAPGTSLDLPYEITFAATPGKEYTNKVHVELNNYHWNYLGEAVDSVIDTTEFVDSRTFTYFEPDEKINDEVTVTDVQTVPAGLTIVSSNYTAGWVTDRDATFFVNQVVRALDVGTWLLKDEAFAKGDTETWSSGEKTLAFTVYDVDVSKTAEPWWNQSYDWTIEKSVAPTELTLLKGETDTVTYTVTVTKTLAGDEFKVNGTITIENSNPEKSARVTVTDRIHRPDGSVVASRYLGIHEIAPLAHLELDYEFFFVPEIGMEYTDVVYVDLENYLWKLDITRDSLYTTGFIGDATFKFTEPTRLVDDSATVVEEEIIPEGFTAVVNWGTKGSPPWTLTDSTTIVFTKNITEVSAQPCYWYDMPNTATLTESDTSTVHRASALVRIHVSEPPPPPSPPSFDFKCPILVEQIKVGETRTLTATASNPGASQSRIYYLTFAAVIRDYGFLQFVGPDYVAHIKIYYNDGTTWEADLIGDITYEKFSGFGAPKDYLMVTWRVSTTYPDGPYLEGNNGGLLSAKVEISFQVQGVAEGTTWLAFFPRATEDHHANGVPLSEINDKANIWGGDLWYPVHNSYDPYDSDIGTGHAFTNLGWETMPTTNNYARIIKLVYVLT